MSTPSGKLLDYIGSVYGDCDNDKQNVPYSLYVAAPDFFKKCVEESDTDMRHLGRFLWFEYFCEKCGTKFVLLPPDYPYCGASSEWTCDECAGVMHLCDPEPVAGTPKKCMTTMIRQSV
jgi:hypothetical protein